MVIRPSGPLESRVEKSHPGLKDESLRDVTGGVGRGQIWI